jgi:NAD(P)H dehydrogenase (quinone)
MKKILIINGHPNSESFNFGLYESYKKGALTAGAEIKEIAIKDLKFNPNLQFGYQKKNRVRAGLIRRLGKNKMG